MLPKKNLPPRESPKADDGEPRPARQARLGPSARHPLNGIILLYEDRDILVADKAPGLLTMGTETQKERTAYFRLTAYVRKGNPKSPKRIFIVHRLDREVSGVLVFAKSETAKRFLQAQWESAEKKYLAVVRGKMKEARGTISSYLTENAARRVYSTEDHARGKLSHTAYRVLKETKDFSLLEITLLTGRKNQIRVHLADIGHPVVGDAKYGDKTRDKGFHRVALHALSLAFNHPFDGRPVAFQTEVPPYFHRLVGGAPQEFMTKEADKNE